MDLSEASSRWPTAIRLPAQVGITWPTLRALRALASRVVSRILRQPRLWVPVLLPPIWLAISTSALSVVETLPQFPQTSSSLTDYMLPGTMLQLALLCAVSCGAQHAQDVSERFHDHLLLTPVPRYVITLAPAFASMVLFSIQAVGIVLALGLLGIRSGGGLAGLTVGILLMTVVCGTMSTLVSDLAELTGDVEVIFIAYPLFILVNLVSTSIMPPDLMSPWFAEMATRNPLSWLLADVRVIFSDGPSWSSAAPAVGTASAFIIVAGLATGALMRRRYGAA